MSKFASLKMNKLLKFNYNFSPVLHNRFVLYFFLLLVIIEIVYFVGSNDIASLVTLLLVGLLTTFFNKNMIVVFVLALVITNILKYGIKMNEGFEGNENMDKSEDKSDDKQKMSDVNEDEEKKDKKKKNDKEGSSDKSKTIDEQYENLKEEYPKFKVVQQEILDGVKKMEPLLQKAESFIDKFDYYKKESFSKQY